MHRIESQSKSKWLNSAGFEVNARDNILRNNLEIEFQ